jgi:hypothetical protein
MKTIRKTLSIFTYIFLIGFVALLAWANWEKPAPSAGLSPIKLAIWQIENPSSDSLTIAKELATQKGITAFSVNPKSQLVSFTFHENQLDESVLKNRFFNKNIAMKTADFESYKGPQCPIPASYIQAIYQVKELLCFR